VKSQGTGIVYGDKETRKQKKGDNGERETRRGRDNAQTLIALVPYGTSTFREFPKRRKMYFWPLYLDT
jgi:hypothetical protein